MPFGGTNLNEAGRLVLPGKRAGGSFLHAAGQALRDAFGAERVLEATDGREALRAIERERPAGLVADALRSL